VTEWMRESWKAYQISYSHGESNNPIEDDGPPGESLSWSENIRTYQIIGCVTAILWWPIWWAGQALTSINISYTPIWKGMFYLNLFSMWISWVVIYLFLMKGMDLHEELIWREVLKSLCFLVAMLFIMDLPLILSLV